MNELIFFGIVIGAICAVIKVFVIEPSKNRTPERISPQYKYSRKKEFITASEKDFFKILEEAAGDRYYIFPQIHLSALFKNETVGRYHKLAFQIINRKSVDYVLCDKVTLEPAYAVELDDSTHDTADRIKRDENVNRLFALSSLPLVRFRNYRNLTAEDIAQKFIDARNLQKF